MYLRHFQRHFPLLPGALSNKLCATVAHYSGDAAVEDLVLSPSCIERLQSLNRKAAAADQGRAAADQGGAAADQGGAAADQGGAAADQGGGVNNAPPQFLRIVVEGGGCSGFQYKFNLEDKLQPDDRRFGPPDASVVTDEVSLSFIKGATVEYHTELIRAAFRIVNNPQSKAGCSCGASFAIKI
ncbi:iron-sulfur cluster insertion protein ErpA [Hyalella azteca]|uniref:Iron-sulfur cluster assembly 2 homolog, mitochondrial n=1 Tax=Hyalella azteca TaxID=294128 RepID=A0A8B7P6L1_HYAAZ|nr:iron-sulfur cluster insertion protein ErpA [Hyalella azteca]